MTPVFQGLMPEADKHAMEEACALLCSCFPETKIFHIVEVGTNDGVTARGFKEFFESHGRSIQYYGFDIKPEEEAPAPFSGALMFRGDSVELFTQIPQGIHLVFIDGCHCNNHVILDFCNFGEKLHKDGLVLFHDTHPADQNLIKNDVPYHYQGHGPKEVAEFHPSVLLALKKVGLRPLVRSDWEFKFERLDSIGWGGIAVFQKLNA